MKKSKDRGPRILAFAIALAVFGMLLAASLAYPATFSERFSGASTTPQDAPAVAEQWGIKLLLIVNGRVARSVDYSNETYPSGDACKDAIIADTKLQTSMQAAATAAAEAFGPTALLAIACSMKLD